MYMILYNNNNYHNIMVCNAYFLSWPGVLVRRLWVTSWK